MNYTKGEWKISKLIEPEGTFPRYYIECLHNNAIAMIDARNANAECDAVLIAAAPSLYEALKAIKANFTNELRMTDKTWGYGMFIREHDVKMYIGAIDEALSKADGK